MMSIVVGSDGRFLIVFIFLVIKVVESKGGGGG